MHSVGDDRGRRSPAVFDAAIGPFRRDPFLDRMGGSGGILKYKSPFLVASVIVWGLASAAALVALPAPIRVGSNVRVSAANPERLHHEIGMASSPVDSRRLLVCSMIFDSKDASRHVVVYLSTDAGTSWKPTLEVSRTSFVGDPDCKFGPDGAAYFVDAATALRIRRRARDARLPVGGRRRDLGGSRRCSLHRSGIPDDRRDAWHTGGGSISMETPYATRPSTATSGSPSPCSARTTRGSRSAIPRSSSRTATTCRSARAMGSCSRTGRTSCRSSNGTTGRNIADTESEKPSGSVKVVRSEDGGERFTKADVVSSDWRTCFGWTPGMPYLATDPGDGPFHDRLYMTWTDRRSGRCEILFSFSSDKGKTWSKPLTVNDDQSPADRERGRDHSIPAWPSIGSGSSASPGTTGARARTTSAAGSRGSPRRGTGERRFRRACASRGASTVP